MANEEKATLSQDEQLEAMKALNEAWQEAHAMPSGAVRERHMDAIKAVSKKLAQAYDLPMAGEGVLDKIAQGGLRAANYASGLMQAPILAGAEAVAGPKGRAREVLSAAIDPRSQPFTAGEVAKDIGIPAGPSASDVIPGYAPAGTPGLWPPNVGGPLDPTLRGLGAAAVDFAASPGGLGAIAGKLGRAESLTATELQALAKAAREAALQPTTMGDRLRAAGKFALDPLSSLVGGVGRGMYNSAFSAADKAAVDAGAGPVSDVMRRNNIWGRPKTLAAAGNDLSAKIGEGVKSDVARAFNLGPELTMSRADLTQKAIAELGQEAEIVGKTGGANRALDRLNSEFEQTYGPIPDNSKKAYKAFGHQIRDIGEQFDPGDPRLEAAINQAYRDYLGTGEFNIAELQDIKRSMQAKAAQQRAYLGQPPNPSRGIRAADSMVEAQQMGDAYKAVANRARRGVENLADQAEPGLGGRIFKQNSDLASLAEGQDALDKAANASFGTMAGKSVPGMMMGGGAGYGMGHDPYAMALGAGLGAAATSTAVRTGLGLAFEKSSPWATNAIRVYLDQKYNPWLRDQPPFDTLNQ